MKSINFHVIESFLLIVCLFSLCSSILAAPAETDAGFGQNGNVLADFANNADGKIVLVQPDNKIVVAGTVFNPSSSTGYDFAVIRLNNDGSLDTAFGDHGKVVTSILARDEVGGGTLQPDGKIVIGGGTGGKFAVVRYNQNGTLDTTFGGTGKIVTDLGSTGSAIHTVLIQPDGKIVAVGQSNGIVIYLVRYNSDGTVDQSFGTAGRVTTQYVPEGNGSSSALLQPDGKILVGGAINANNSASNLALFRFNGDGSLDSSFDGDGVAVAALSPSHDGARKILLRADGKIFIVASAVNAELNTIDYAFGVFNIDGTPDLSFGVNGFTIVPSFGNTDVEDAQLQIDGKIVVAGTKTVSGTSYSRFLVARFNANGTVDSTFGNGGITTPFVGQRGFGTSLALQPDNKILVAGSGTAINASKSQFAVTRLVGGNGAVPQTATITGRVINYYKGTGVGRVQVILTKEGNESPIYAQTNPLGFYRFPNLPVNARYTIIIRLKRTPVFQSSLQVMLNGDEYADELLFRY